MRRFAALGALCALTACVVPPPENQYLPSTKNAAELRVAQTKLVPGDADTVMRAVIATLHDLGYRITKVESDAGTVSATRQTALRIAVVTRPRSPAESIVRANATVVALYREAQVDSPEFYRQNFFEPLGASMQRRLAEVPAEAAAPEPVRPTAERNSLKERQAASPPATSSPPAPERKSP